MTASLLKNIINTILDEIDDNAEVVVKAGDDAPIPVTGVGVGKNGGVVIFSSED